MISKPNDTEYAPYYARYVALIADDAAMAYLKDLSFYNSLKELPEDKWNFKYQPEKWSIKEVLLHLIDTERIFAYRALRISRQDYTPLPGFDQDAYVPHYDVDNRSVDSLLEEFKTCRASSLALFKNFNDSQLLEVGEASDKSISVRALVYLIAGHQKHHANIIKERYL